MNIDDLLDVQVGHVRCVRSGLRQLRVPHKFLLVWRGMVVYELNRCDETGVVRVNVEPLVEWIKGKKSIKLKERFIIDKNVFSKTVNEWSSEKSKYNLFFNNCWNFVKDVRSKRIKNFEGG